MEQTPSREAKSHSASQEIFRILWNPKVSQRVHNSPSIVPILSHLHSVYNLTPSFTKIHLNIILPFTPRSSA